MNCAISWCGPPGITLRSDHSSSDVPKGCREGCQGIVLKLQKVAPNVPDAVRENLQLIVAKIYRALDPKVPESFWKTGESVVTEHQRTPSHHAASTKSDVHNGVRKRSQAVPSLQTPGLHRVQIGDIVCTQVETPPDFHSSDCRWEIAKEALIQV